MNPQEVGRWKEAKRRCRLSEEEVAMAKELGMSPRGLIKNIPSPNQSWKLPVKEWVRNLYAKRFGDRTPVRPAERYPAPSRATPAEQKEPTVEASSTPGTDRFRGFVCHYGECPKGKRECDVAGCGAQPFLQLYADFTFHPFRMFSEPNEVLFKRARRGAGTGSVAGDEEIPF